MSPDEIPAEEKKLKDLTWKDVKKALTGLTGAVIGFATIVIASPTPGITAPEWLLGGIGLATAAGIYKVTNG